jgi:pimeloyl-ACP methyl ester carboxylesterase
MREYFGRLFHSPPLVIHLLTRDFHRIMHGAAVSSLVASLGEEDFLAAEELARVRCPSLLVWGESDRLIPAGCRDFYLAHLPGVRYEPLARCGHCPQLEAPRRTAALLCELPALSAARAAAAA